MSFPLYVTVLFKKEGSDAIHLSFKIFYSFIFRERGKEGEREREKHQYAGASHVPPPGDIAPTSGMCSGWGSSQ